MITPDQLHILLPDTDIKTIEAAIPSDMHLDAIMRLDELYDALVETKAFKISDEYQRRDPREPHRTIKEAFEDKLEKLIKKLFGRQKKNILAKYERNVPYFNRSLEPPKVNDEDLKDDDIKGALFLIFLAMALDSNEIFLDDVKIPQEKYSQNALIAARVAVGDMIRGINGTTRARIQEAVALFAETPGMTLKQLADMLPFPGYRARLIAVTEVSNMYGEMALRNAELLTKEFPGMEVVRTWFTNNDPQVCKICIGLDGKQAVWPKPFISDFDGGEYFKPSDPHPGCRCWTSTNVREKG